MAVAFDAVGTTGITNASHTGATAQTYTHTVGSSATAVILGIGIHGNGTIPWSSYTPTAVTFGGAAMTLLAEMGNNAVTNATGFVALYKLLNPSTGAQTVSVTLPGTFTWWANSVSYTGVGSFGTAVTNSGSSVTPSTGAVSSATGHMVTSILAAAGNSAPSAHSQTERFVQSGITSECGDIQDAAGASTVTTTITVSSAAWAAVAVDLAPVTTPTNLFFSMF